MNTPTDSPTFSEPVPPADTGASELMALAVVLHPLLVGGAVWVFVFFSLLANGYDDTGAVGWSVFATFMAVWGSHYLLQWILRRRKVPRPWEFPSLLSVAVVLATAHFLVTVVLWIDFAFTPFMPPVCLALSLLGYWVLLRARHRRFLSAFAAMVVLTLLLVGLMWGIAETERRTERDELMREADDFPLAIAVLDAPAWEPSAVWITDDPWRVDITYEPIVPTPELEGFRLRLTSTALPVYGEERTLMEEGCDPEDDRRVCAWSGDLLLVDRPGGDPRWSVVMTEFTGGGLAELLVVEPEGYDEYPDIDLVELAEHVREEVPGERESLVEAVKD